MEEHMYGGTLLHRLRWAKGMEFSATADTYVMYIKKNYKSNITVVFYGYQDKSTKNHEHHPGILFHKAAMLISMQITKCLHTISFC